LDSYNFAAVAFKADREFGLIGIADMVLKKEAARLLIWAMRGHGVQGGLINMYYVHTLYISLWLSNNFNIDYNFKI
jgi:hypothetical protein